MDASHMGTKDRYERREHAKPPAVEPTQPFESSAAELGYHLAGHAARHIHARGAQFDTSASSIRASARYTSIAVPSKAFPETLMESSPIPSISAASSRPQGCGLESRVRQGALFKNVEEVMSEAVSAQMQVAKSLVQVERELLP